MAALRSSIIFAIAASFASLRVSARCTTLWVWVCLSSARFINLSMVFMLIILLSFLYSWQHNRAKPILILKVSP